ncbi:EamA family transporter RarD [Arenibacterium sp. CAU 1754]
MPRLAHPLGKGQGMGEAQKGILAMAGACAIWGCMPLIYKPLAHIPSEEVLAHRVMWSLVFYAGILLIQGRLGRVRDTMRGARNAGNVALAAGAISLNWFLIIFATAVGRNTEGSLGYYIYPLLAVLLGRVLFKERMDTLQTIAVLLAGLAVLVLTVGMGMLPWISVVLAVSFAWYGVIKKRMNADALVSVTAELVMFLPVVALIFAYVYGQGKATFGHDAFDSIYIMIAGPVTALPLILFSYAARRVRMSTIGLMQYSNPTLQFLTAVVLFGEPFTTWHAATFLMIWTAVALYSVALLRQDRAARRAAMAASGVSTTVRKSTSEASANP